MTTVINNQNVKVREKMVLVQIKCNNNTNQHNILQMLLQIIVQQKVIHTNYFKYIANSYTYIK